MDRPRAEDYHRPMMVLRLELRVRDEAPRVVFPRASLRVGRLSDNELVVADRMVSGNHLAFEHHGEGWRVRDLGSRNGTTLNGQRMTAEPLRDGDVVALGHATIHARFVTLHEPSIAEVQFIEAGFEQVRSSMLSAEPGGFPPAEAITDPEVLRRDYDKLRLAHELSLHLGFERDTDRLLARVLEFCFQVLPVEHGAALLRHDPGTRLDVRAARSRMPGESIALSRSLVDRVLNTGEGLLLADASKGTLASAASIHDGQIRSVIAAPLPTREGPGGVLFLANCSRPDAFAEKDLHLVVGMAAQAALALERVELLRRVESETERRVFLTRFLSPALVEEVQSDRVDLQQQGELRRVAVLFADLRSFTRTAEALGPADTVRMLNEHFEHLVDEVFRFGGVLDKFVGDALMALWGAPVQRDDDALRALRCALSMQRRIARLGANRAERGLDPQRIGVGVHIGDAVVGSMGAPMRLDYTAIGPCVNLASRLCSLAGPGEVVTSLTTAQSLADQFVLSAPSTVGVKGFSEPVAVCRVTGER
jgi:adenylate cyclase